jgi:hypothetical protein
MMRRYRAFFFAWPTLPDVGLTPEARFFVIVDDADRLHPGIDNDRPDKFESAFFEILGKGDRKVRLGNCPMIILDNWFAAGLFPDIVTKVYALFPHFKIGPGIADGGFDFGPGADDALVSHELIYIFVSKFCHFDRVEVFEGLSEAVSTLEDDKPGKTGLKALEHQHLPELAAVFDRHSPLFIMVGSQKRVAFRPAAACLHF